MPPVKEMGLPGWKQKKDAALRYALYNSGVDCLAKSLVKHILQKDDRIGVLGKHSLEYFLVYGAASALDDSRKFQCQGFLIGRGDRPPF